MIVWGQVFFFNTGCFLFLEKMRRNLIWSVERVCESERGVVEIYVDTCISICIILKKKQGVLSCIVIASSCSYDTLLFFF